MVSLITLQCGSNKSAISPEVSRERPLPRSAISLLRCSGKRTLILPAVVVVVASAAQPANYWPDEDRFRKGISRIDKALSENSRKNLVDVINLSRLTLRDVFDTIERTPDIIPHHYVLRAMHNIQSTHTEQVS